MRSDKPLLTIAIPTYNRSSFLDLCLSQIFKQIGKNEYLVEILISNNSSTDNTDEIVNKYISSGFAISYLNNNVNLGGDRNFIQCFDRSNGKYVLILGDDDILLDGSIRTILGILKNNEFGIVHFNAYNFVNDYISERPKVFPRGIIVYTDPVKFASKVSYFLTFISRNIINKSLISHADLNEFMGTSLVQLGWTFSALISSKRNVYIKEYLLAAKLYNSGVYRLSDVFAVNINKIFDALTKKGADLRIFDIINKKLLAFHFPAQIIRTRNNMIKLEKEDYYKTLYPLYHNYPYFWLFTVPAIILPLRVVTLIFSLARVIRRNVYFI